MFLLSTVSALVNILCISAESAMHDCISQVLTVQEVIWKVPYIIDYIGVYVTICTET